MEKIALENYEIGYNCAQALLKTFAKEKMKLERYFFE